jgi:hypothetical protein
MEDEPEPDFMYSSTMHGDETVGYVTLLRLIEYLLSNYNTDSRITNLINETEIWINPLANPDGTYASGDNTVNGATRNNAATLLTGMDGKPGVDLNRNFPDPRSGLHPDNYEWQPENIAMMNFLKAHTFAMSANFHSGEEVVNYPWDTWYKTHPDDAWYKYVSHLYADAVLAVAPLGYFNGFDRGISNGAMWYVINGGRQDYQNYYLHSREVTIEMSASKMPAASELPDFWNYHKEALLKYMEQVQYGIRGFVTDNETGNPLRAKLTVLGHDADSSQIYTDPLHGNFNRLIAQGVYDLKFSAPGYQDLVVLGVSVTNNVATNLNVKLDPAPLATNTLTDEIVDAFVAPNPITDESVLSYFLPTPQNVSLRIVGMNGYVLFSNTQFVDEGKHTFDFAFLGLDRGVYVCNVSIGAYAKQIKLLVVK